MMSRSMILRILFALGAFVVVALIHPLAAQAGWCTSLPDCGGGSVAFAQTVAVAAGTIGAMGAASGNGGEWAPEHDEWDPQ